MNTITKAETAKAVKLMQHYWPALSLTADALDAWHFAISARQLNAQAVGAAIDKLLSTHTGGYPPTLPQLLDVASAGTRRAGAKHIQATGEEFAGIIRHNAERGLVPVLRRVGELTTFAFCPRNACHNGRIAKLRGVMVEVFDC